MWETKLQNDRVEWDNQCIFYAGLMAVSLFRHSLYQIVIRSVNVLEYLCLQAFQKHTHQFFFSSYIRAYVAYIT